MADSYTQFSVMIPFPADVEQVRAFLKVWEVESDAAQEEDEDDWYNTYGGFEYEPRPEEGVRVHDTDRSGNVEAAALFIQRYLHDLGMKEAVYMGWANTCSKPRINEFSGGGVVITATKMYWVNSYDSLKEAADDCVDPASIYGA
jgi:hypothetical protein